MTAVLPDPSATPTKDDHGHDALDELDTVGLKEVLDQDSRPTFVLDLDSDYVEYGDRKDELRPVFCNAALSLHHQLLDSVTTGVGADVLAQDTDATAYGSFKSWASGFSKVDKSRDIFPLTFFYRDLLWTGSTVRQRWRIISGNQCYQTSQLPKGDLHARSPDRQATETTHLSPRKDSPETKDRDVTMEDQLNFKRPRIASATVQNQEASEPTLVASTHGCTPDSAKVSDEKSNDTTGSGSSITLASPEQDCPDWTAAEPTGVLSDHIRFARSVNWAATPLGPISSWSREFREITNLVMRNPHPCSLFWGEELTMFYNEAYKNEVAGNKHPELMGTGFSGPFSELWDGVAPIFRECARTGKSVRKENDPLPIHRYGYLEETFFSWSFIPLYGGTNKILGFYNGPFETTYQTISSRRMQTLRQLGERLAQTRSIKHFWKSVLASLEDNHYDIPFALLYSITDAEDADTASHSSDSTISLKCCILEGSIGIPDDHAASPPKLDLKRSKEGFIPAFREAMRTREPTTLHTRDGTLPEELLEGFEWKRGYGDPCKEAIIIPVRPTNNENILAFLVIGINPRRAYDEDYKTFAAMLNRQLATSLASFLLFEDEVRRNRSAAEAAALQRERLSQQLELQTSRMRRMTELSPLGMYLYSPDGILLEANERYYEMTGHPRDETSQISFLDLIEPESVQVAEGMWNTMVKDQQPSSEELKLKVTKEQPRDLNNEPIEYWVLASSIPEIGPDGKIISIMGSIADISHMKWAQGLQDQRLREAEETKRQQNEFIDITSHEMRNPLSAILICADDIRDTLSRYQFPESDAAVVDDCIEAANNIALCVQHQKSIVDDILTVSKLDSNLLLITPVPVQPVTVIERAMSMFRPEVQAKDIDFKFAPHYSLQKLNVDWVNLDPSRLLQITVNLITNAIKFTSTCSKRHISVHLGVSVDEPDLESKGFEFVPTRGALVNITKGEDWGEGELLYVWVQVKDTGCGLTAEEKQLLFQRFAQASPRTHAHYGGSGLGLFISRQLAELHGGQIGVSSEADVGSVFGFFVQARRVTPDKIPPTPTRPKSFHREISQPDETHLAPGQLQYISIAAAPTRSPQMHKIASTSQHRSSSAPAPLPSIPSPTLATPDLTSENRLHVLVVEDNLVNQRVLSKQLVKNGCHVDTANNGIIALTHLATTSYQAPNGVPLSVILMDLEMPEMDGITCVSHIRSMEREGKIKGHVPVIAVTANVREEQKMAAKKSGMDDVVSKPFRIPELLGKIRDVLERLEGQKAVE